MVYEIFDKKFAAATGTNRFTICKGTRANSNFQILQFAEELHNWIIR